MRNFSSHLIQSHQLFPPRAGANNESPLMDRIYPHCSNLALKAPVAIISIYVTTLCPVQIQKEEHIKVHSAVRAISQENVRPLPAITNRKGGNDRAFWFSLIVRVREPLIWTECFSGSRVCLHSTEEQNEGLMAPRYQSVIVQDCINGSKRGCRLVSSTEL